MSRTKHHRGQKNRHNGSDLWSKRPMSGEAITAKNKKLSRRKERRILNKALDF